MMQRFWAEIEKTENCVWEVVGVQEVDFGPALWCVS